MKKEDFKFLFSAFVVWRVFLLFFLVLSANYLVLQENYLGGGMENYLSAPWLWSWANFDGEHYMSIALGGYRSLTYFFFPVYPFLIRQLAFGKELLSYLLSGLFVTHVSFILTLIGLWKLILLDYKKTFAKLVIVLLLVFPTSFYFGSVYTEGLFLSFAVWSFYFARKRRWLLAGLLGAFSTGTRIVGLALIPALLVEAWLQKKKKVSSKMLIGVFLVPVGLLLYMYYLKTTTGDPLIFFNSLSDVFGEQRSTKLILFPQVFYRYIFKIIPNLNYSYFPVVFSTFLELIAGSLFLTATVLSFYRLRLSYAVYLLVGYLIPTFSGSFSSFPRYALVLFPAFFVGAVYLEKLPKFLQWLVFTLLFICLGVATSLFLKGYWIS